MKYILWVFFVIGAYVGYKNLKQTGTNVSDDGYRGSFWELFRD